MIFHVLALLGRAIGLMAKGRVSFPGNLGDLRMTHLGEEFTAFRRMVVSPTPEQPANPGAKLLVRFHFKNLPMPANIKLSLIPIPLILAQPGFRSKTWLLGNSTEDFIGFYEFDAVAAAQAYMDSVPMMMMSKRAAKDSLSYEILPQS